jgi:hypothetical protein
VVGVGVGQELTIMISAVDGCIVITFERMSSHSLDCREVVEVPTPYFRRTLRYDSKVILARQDYFVVQNKGQEYIMTYSARR